MDDSDQVNDNVELTKVYFIRRIVKQRDFLNILAMGVFDEVSSDKAITTCDQYPFHLFLFCVVIFMDTMDKERKEGKETHDWRVEGASAAEKGKEEGNKEEYKE